MLPARVLPLRTRQTREMRGQIAPSDGRARSANGRPRGHCHRLTRGRRRGHVAGRLRSIRTFRSPKDEEFQKPISRKLATFCLHTRILYI